MNPFKSTTRWSTRWKLSRVNRFHRKGDLHLHHGYLSTARGEIFLNLHRGNPILVEGMMRREAKLLPSLPLTWNWRTASLKFCFIFLWLLIKPMEGLIIKINFLFLFSNLKPVGFCRSFWSQVGTSVTSCLSLRNCCFSDFIGIFQIGCYSSFLFWVESVYSYLKPSTALVNKTVSPYYGMDRTI